MSAPTRGTPKMLNFMEDTTEMVMSSTRAWLSPSQWEAYFPWPAKVDLEMIKGLCFFC